MASTTVHSPEWEAEDRAWVQAYFVVQKDKCSGCGQHRSDMDKDPKRALAVVAKEYKCKGCETIENYKTDLSEKGESATNGVYVYAEFDQNVYDNLQQASERRRKKIT